mgnify:CR=1 FL=1|jgi:dnd system-associated protein 4
MAMLNRVRVAKDKADLVRSLLRQGEMTTAPFPTYADILAFAAALGAKRQRRSPIGTAISREPTPVALDIFISRGYDRLIQLLAIISTEDAKILSPSNAEAEAQRVAIFEEYANGGLEILQGELRGVIDYTEHLLLLLTFEANPDQPDPDGFDLRRFL